MKGYLLLEGTYLGGFTVGQNHLKWLSHSVRF